MISMIAVFLFLTGCFIVNVFGSKYRNEYNKVDYIGGGLILLSIPCFLYVIAIFCLTYLP